MRKGDRAVVGVTPQIEAIVRDYVERLREQLHVERVILRRSFICGWPHAATGSRRLMMAADVGWESTRATTRADAFGGARARGEDARTNGRSSAL